MKRRRRRKIRVVRVTIFVVAILIVIFVGSKGAGFLINLKQTDTEEVTAKYKAETPVKRDYNEAEKKLAGLSEKYPEFKPIYNNRNELEVPLSLGLGATLDFEAGNVKRAPVWMSAHGLEWLYRIFQEPKRMFKRYFVDFIKIVPLIWKYK